MWSKCRWVSSAVACIGVPSARTSRCRTSPKARKPGAQVDDQRLVPLDVDHEARGVAPVAPVAIARARARPPHAVERDVHPPDVTLPRGGTFCTHGATDDHCERAGVRLPDRRARRRAARPLPARIPRHGAHLALPPARAGRRRLPRRGAVPARLRPDRRCRPTGATRWAPWCRTPTRCTRCSAAVTTPSSSGTTGAPWPPTARWPTNPTAGGGP